MYDHIVGKSTLLLIIQVGNTSNLILDPDFDRYYAMNTVITKMPELVQLTGQANAHVTDLILTRENSESKKQLIAFILARIDPVLGTIDNRLQTAVNEKPSLPGKLSLPIRTQIEAVQAFDDMLRRQVLDAGPSIFAKLDLKSVNANELNTLNSSPASIDSTSAGHFL